MSGVRGLKLGCAALALTGCAHAERRFPLREPLWRDTDLAPVWVPCHREATKQDPHHLSCAPVARYNAYMWDIFDSLLFRPLSESLALTANDAGESVNVNSLDEVPDSAWFTNRIGVRPVSPRELRLGRCTPELLVDGRAARDGSWVIDKGKESGATDGFRVTIPGKGKYLFKADDEGHPERATAAQTVGTGVYYAAGLYVPCEQIVYFKPSALKLTPGLRRKDNLVKDVPFDEAALEAVLAHCPKRGGLVRMQASAWLPGYNVGGAEYYGTRSDDPNDVVPHEKRRELRAKRLLDAWLDRTDDRMGNTIDAWVSDRPGPPDSSPGHIIHNALDPSESLGAVFTDDDITKRLGHSYVWDWGDVGTDFAVLGTRTNVWDTITTQPGKEDFGYYNVKDFVPDKWKDEQPVAAFSRMTERDGAWMARLLAHFTPEVVESLAEMAEYSNPDDTAYLEKTLEGRLEKILDRYLTRLSPIADVHIERMTDLCAVDLAEWRGLRAPTVFRYTARLLGHGWTTVTRQESGKICVALPHVAPDGRTADDDASRYVRVRVEDGVASGPLIAHLYDLGPARGYRLAGLERTTK
jgi:hypothetical protein